MKSKVTIKDIAKECGVSITTVSRVLNNVEGSCSIETEKKIQDAIIKLEYHPNPIARSLVTKKTNMIAVVIPDICNFFFQDFSKGAENVCNKRGYRLLLCSTDGSTTKETSYLSSLSQGVVDGIIVTTQNDNDKNKYIAELFHEHFPIMAVERYGEDINQIPSVTLDNANGIYQAVMELHRNGHKKIAYIGGPEKANNGRLRKEGYFKAMEEAGLELNPNIICEGDYKMQSGYECISKFIEKEEFTALVVANELMAIGACKAIREHNKSVPEDISVVSFDGTILAEIHQPPLDTVMIHGEEMGRIAAENLIKIIEGKKGIQKKVRIQPKLRKGESIKRV